jgi:16S rRNA A1518/A1519 N6-dimethyltransferase RsmA/KsgA/DIM1 with predicted DNA glycosylase/AP lyase activity
LLEKFNNKKFNKKNSYKAASSYEELVLDYICSNIDTKEFKYTFEYFVSRNINFIQKIGKAIKLKKKDNIIDIGSGFLGNLKIYKLFKKKNISIIEIEKKFILNCKAILKNIPFEVNFIHNNFFNFKKKKNLI